MQRAEDVHREAQRIKEMAEFKTQFLSNAAHELATPLTPLKLQLATMRGRLASQDPEGFRMLERNVHRLGTLVDDLLDAARLQAGHLRLRPAPLPVPDLLGRVCVSFAPQAGVAGVTLGVLGSPPALQVVGDETRVEQVLFNLVHNALKFTPRGGQVWLAADVDGPDAVIRVQDTGIGLTPAQAERLFQPFTQVHDTSQVPKAGGTGLGLYIAKGIAEQHGGDLRVESPGPGRGCTFTLRLPQVPASAAAGAAATAPGPPRAGAAPSARRAGP